MELELNNKRVLVTGSSRGIGRSIAHSFLREGSKVYMISRGIDDLTDVAGQFKNNFGEEAIAFGVCDCSNTKALEAVKIDIEELWGGLDILVLNVGNGEDFGEHLPDENDWNIVWDKNFNVAINALRVFLPMITSSSGSIVLISSIAGLESIGAPVGYSTAKAALNVMAKNLAKKLGGVIRINIIAPGNINFKDGAWDKKIKLEPKKINDLICRSVPMRRFGTPEEVADAVVFLSSGKASFITGATLVIDGGQTVGYF